MAKTKSLDNKLKKKEDRIRLEKNIKNLFKSLIEGVSDWEEIEIGTTTKYTKLNIENGKMFAEVTKTARALKVVTLDIFGQSLGSSWEVSENGFEVRRVPDDFGWVLNTEFRLYDENQLKAFLPYLKKSYEIRLVEKREKIAKERRLRELEIQKNTEEVIYGNGRKSIGQLKKEMTKANLLYRKGSIDKAEAYSIAQAYIDRYYELCLTRYNEFREMCKKEGIVIKVDRPTKPKPSDFIKKRTS